jgi:putative flavoprotein involved in K+ transport
MRRDTEGGGMVLDTIVVGGSQGGLTTGYHLKRRGQDFVILDAGERVGDAWRTRWDSLRLFTPARHNALPGMRLPAPPGAYPTKDDMADYLQAYATRHELPVRLGRRVKHLDRQGDHFVVSANGERLQARQVVVATSLSPRLPPFAGQLDPAIQQLQAGQYRNPGRLPDGPVLIVGAGNSGAEIAMDLAPTRRVWLSGRDTGRMPLAALRSRLFWLLADHALTVDTRLGRKAAQGEHRGTPLARIRPQDLARAGVERVPPTQGVRDGRPLLADGRTLDVAAVLWCTGFGPDYRWIHLPVFGHNGLPRHRRGVVEDEHARGLYFVGLPFQYSLSSGLIHGMVRDAAHVAGHLLGDARATRRLATR